MSNTTPYDIVQTTFMLAMASASAANVEDTPANVQRALAVALNGGTLPDGKKFAGFFPFANAQLAGGDWSVVWGPAIFMPPLVAPATAGYYANAMYVAHSPSQSMYVVAIAGTNFNSTYDLDDEDGNVAADTMAQFPFTVPFVQNTHPIWSSNPPPAVAAGTALGVSNLLTQMPDPTTGNSLQTYLNSVAATGNTLIVTGHSLGGALAPTLALLLYPEPTNSGWKQVYVLPLAGPTPGNAPFAQQFGTAYPPTSSGVGGVYDNWNADYVNDHDAVPCAWANLSTVVSAPDASGKYPSIYGVMDKVVGTKVTGDVGGAEQAAAGGGYANLDQVSFFPTGSGLTWGMWDWKSDFHGGWQYPPEWTPLNVYTDGKPIETKGEILTLAQGTHVDQYYYFFGVIPAPQLPT